MGEGVSIVSSVVLDGLEWLLLKVFSLVRLPFSLFFLARKSRLLLGCFLFVLIGVSWFPLSVPNNMEYKKQKENPKNPPTCCSTGPEVPSLSAFFYITFCVLYLFCINVQRFSGREREKSILLVQK